MKSKFLLGFTMSFLAIATISLNSCTKEEVEEEIVKGCTDPESTNYNMAAEEDDGSCLYAADNLLGTWNIKETVSGNTVEYSATISKVNNSDIIILSSRSNPPVYHINSLQVTVNWAESKIEKPGSTVSGTIEDKDDFMINYIFGSGANIFIVNQHYTR